MLLLRIGKLDGLVGGQRRPPGCVAHAHVMQPQRVLTWQMHNWPMGLDRGGVQRAQLPCSVRRRGEVRRPLLPLKICQHLRRHVQLLSSSDGAIVKEFTVVVESSNGTRR